MSRKTRYQLSRKAHCELFERDEEGHIVRYQLLSANVLPVLKLQAHILELTVELLHSKIGLHDARFELLLFGRTLRLAVGFL